MTELPGFFGTVPAVLIALSMGWQQALYVALLYFGVQTFEGNVTAPLIQQRATDLPPALTLVAQTAFLSPIEPGWAKRKSSLRRVAACTVEALQQALASALDSITAQDAAGFFRHCGYLQPN
jgi:AI-2E family transporter